MGKITCYKYNKENKIKNVQQFMLHNYISQMNIFQFNLSLKIMKMYML